ncbi:hypothetical protein [Piscibacillus halophilus]|uniref:Permease n=1 Tax=Piscibacillus halophilus TaxID=571933 RepID=A0A1H9CG53_9BACI|nr:hypothetical protein [Piscibacillus halophilus]SEQ00134.1 hypothetical protein SAMN05216362_10559 [Piscibacillus halophilus]
MFKSNNSRTVYLILAILMTINAVFISITTIYAGDFPAGIDMITISLAYMGWSIYYLYPQFKMNDERTKRIKERGLFYSFFGIMGFLLFIIIFIGFFDAQLETMKLIQYLTSFIMIMIWTSFIVTSKRM